MHQLFELENIIQNYVWGSSTELVERFGIQNPDGLPQAEIWIGAHPRAPSRILTGQGMEPLNKLVSQSPDFWLGEHHGRASSSLPFLFKVLAVASPLSIQVHPDQSQAQQGYELEEERGVKTDSPLRNYPDNHHKPELLYAVSHFQLLKGFRPLKEIVSLIHNIAAPLSLCLIESVSKQPEAEGLQELCRALFRLSDVQRRNLIDELLAGSQCLYHELFQQLMLLQESYPYDIGVLAPLLMNRVELLPGQALFIEAGCLHCYLQGVGLEVMANSDNVLRCGLTHKHIDQTELLKVVRFNSQHPELISIVQASHAEQFFPVPVNDFALSLLSVNSEANIEKQLSSAAIAFCVSGRFMVTVNSNYFFLSAGKSCFITPGEEVIHFSGNGQLALVTAPSLS